MRRLFAKAVRTGCLAECHFKSCGLAGAAMTRARRVITSELGSKPEKLNASRCFPLFTQQRTSPRYVGMSVSCTRSGRPPKALFDHGSRAGDEPGRYPETI